MSSNKYKNGNAIPFVYDLYSFNILQQEAMPGIALLKNLLYLTSQYSNVFNHCKYNKCFLLCFTIQISF